MYPNSRKIKQENHRSPVRDGLAGNIPGRRFRWLFILLLIALMGQGCASGLQTKISGNLNQLSREQTVAILPPEQTEEGQKETASLFRRSLHANLKHARFQVMERYVVDELLKQSGLTHPAEYPGISPLKLGEILGADAVVISRINRVDRAYLIIHSQIEVSISTEMVDTRTGEILWRAEQTESDFQGIGKIPTGMTSALWAPIQFVTNKLNLHKITYAMVQKLTQLVKRPEQANTKEKFSEPVIARAARRDFEQLQLAQAKARLKPEPAPVQVAALPATAEKVSSPSKQKQPGLWGKMDLSRQFRSAPEVPSKATPGEVRHVALEQRNKGVPLVQTEQPPLVEKPGSIQKSQKVRVAHTRPRDGGLWYTLQAGAYKTKAYAERMMQYLLDKGHHAFVSFFKKDEQPIYRVHVDKFESAKEARQMSRDLKSKEKLNTIVTIVRPAE